MSRGGKRDSGVLGAGCDLKELKTVLGMVLLALLFLSNNVENSFLHYRDEYQCSSFTLSSKQNNIIENIALSQFSIHSPGSREAGSALEVT